MKLLFRLLVVCAFTLSWSVRAQDNPLNDPELQKMLKQAQELQKGMTPAKLSDLQKKAKEMQAEAEKENSEREAKEKAALQKQLAAPEPKILPEWTPATPQFIATGGPVKKIDDGQVKVIQTGTSTMSPKELGDAWAAGVADKPVNQSRNNIESNGKKTVILFLSTRTEPREELEMEAAREPGGKITRVTIALNLPKPEVEDEE